MGDMSLRKFLPWARFAALAIPLFGLVSAMQLGCEATVADDVGIQDSESNRGYGRYGNYGGYGYNGYDGYDGYGYP